MLSRGKIVEAPQQMSDILLDVRPREILLQQPEALPDVVHRDQAWQLQREVR
jgi:hypothetical protein